MEARIIISQSPALSGNLKALATVPGILNDLVNVLFQFEQETGITVADLSVKQATSNFITTLSQVIPNSDRARQLHLRIDALNDAQQFGQWTREKIVEREGSKLAGLSLTREAMLEMIQVPEETIQDLIQAKRDFDSFCHELPREQIFWDYLNITEGKVCVYQDAEACIIERLTVYANAAQTKFIHAANDLLSQISDLEKTFHASGLVLKASALHGDTYKFNSEFLNQVHQ